MRAIHSPHTGIVDWGFVARHFGKMFKQQGGEIVLNFEAEQFVSSSNPEYPLKIVSTNKVIILSLLTPLLIFLLLFSTDCLIVLLGGMTDFCKRALHDSVWWLAIRSIGAKVGLQPKSKNCAV